MPGMEERAEGGRGRVAARLLRARAGALGELFAFLFYIWAVAVPTIWQGFVQDVTGYRDGFGAAHDRIVRFGRPTNESEHAALIASLVASPGPEFVGAEIRCSPIIALTMHLAPQFFQAWLPLDQEIPAQRPGRSHLLPLSEDSFAVFILGEEEPHRLLYLEEVVGTHKVGLESDRSIGAEVGRIVAPVVDEQHERWAQRERELQAGGHEAERALGERVLAHNGGIRGDEGMGAIRPPECPLAHKEEIGGAEGRVNDHIICCSGDLVVVQSQLPVAKVVGISESGL